MADNRFLRDASDRLYFGMFNLPAESYAALCNEIEARFALTAASEPFGLFATFYQDYWLGDQVVGLEWDNWSGFIIVAKSSQAESLVQTIGSWLLSSAWATCGASDA